MPLNKNTLRDDLLAAFLQNDEINPESIDILKSQMQDIANAIDDFVRSGDIMGVTTTITGSATPVGVVTGAGVQTTPVKVN
jgi:hypothetical protein